MSVWRKFLPPREEKWRSYCEDLNGTYVERGFWKGDHIEIPYRGFVFWLSDEGRSDPEGGSCPELTELRLRVSVRAGVGFAVLRNWPFQAIYELVLSALMETEVPGLDGSFMIMTREKESACRVLCNPHLQELLHQHHQIIFKMGTDAQLFGQSEGNITISVPEFITNLPQLESLVELMQATIDVALEEGHIDEPAQV